ncbi:NEDD8 protease Nep2 [Schizosaccharomyces cryophilus OY26]|uniref:NEDD8 protease Nep2 n=1 Tax=Schizosaccharomyces cryophilus (strain OY26 / ATCC MYA-4695 / CBS 11777 / NBRC 106824 / NRRL Y48691) TaxID=653667 RepID=S9X612_SCHCR|nr:NEDD8 protease Nep2 [Schizosaccharomyces cryophilus OY26]EPY49231.1 NEDD8 protease Nep2 [Schizosaccharomyces cryophilus OY26]
MRSNSIFYKEIDSPVVKKTGVERPPSNGSSSSGSDNSHKKKKKGFLRSLFSSSSSNDGKNNCSSLHRIWIEYYEVCLRKDDVDHFNPGYWILDTNIDFYYEILVRQVLQKQPPENQGQIYLLRPAMVFFLAQAPDPTDIVSALPPAMFNASFIFLPINDTNECGIESGSHWSLLVVSVEKGLGWYYDSMSNGNTNDCNLAIKNLSILFKKDFRIRHMKTPQQINDCDCGLHVCENTRILMYRLLQKPYIPRVDMSIENTKVDSHRIRKNMMQIITGLITEYGSKVPNSPDFVPDLEKDSRIFARIFDTVLYEDNFSEDHKKPTLSSSTVSMSKKPKSTTSVPVNRHLLETSSPMIGRTESLPHANQSIEIH